MIHQPPAYAPPAPPRNAAGTAALVLGILAVVLSWVPFVGFVSYPLAVVGVILGGIGLRRLPRGRAVAGTVLSGVGLLSVILATVVYVGLLYAATSGDTSAGTVPSTQPSVLATHASKTQTKAKTAVIGQKVRDGKFEFVITKVGYAHNVGGQFGETAHGRYAVVTMRVTNIGTESQDLDDSAQAVYDGEGRKFDADSAADLFASNGSDGAWFQSLNPGTSTKGHMYFDMPKKDKPVKIELHDSTFSEGVTVSLR